MHKEEIVSETFPELLKLLEELEEEGKFVDIQICPRCKSARVRRIRTMEGDLSSHLHAHACLALTPIKYECPDCGWRERLVIKATNRPLGFKEIAITYFVKCSDVKARVFSYLRARK